MKRKEGRSGNEGLPNSNEEILEMTHMYTILIVVMAASAYMCQNLSYYTLKYMQFIVHQLYLNKTVFKKFGMN